MVLYIVQQLFDSPRDAGSAVVLVTAYPGKALGAARDLARAAAPITILETKLEARGTGRMVYRRDACGREEFKHGFSKPAMLDG